MAFEKAIADIKSYHSYYRDYGFLKRAVYLVFTHQMYAVLIYRFGRWAECECGVPIIAFVCRTIHFFLAKFSNLILGVYIRPWADIGAGLKIEQIGCIYLEGKIGKNCRVQQGVTVGHIGGFRGGGAPTLGDNVYIGAGAKILGDVKIGNNVKIGANAVVITDVPDDSVAVGVPARVIPPTGSNAE